MSMFGELRAPVLFLTNNDNTQKLFEWIQSVEPDVVKLSEPLVPRWSMKCSLDSFSASTTATSFRQRS